MAKEKDGGIVSNNNHDRLFRTLPKRPFHTQLNMLICRAVTDANSIRIWRKKKMENVRWYLNTFPLRIT